MIVGHGIDFLEVERVKHIYDNFKSKFIQKYFKTDKARFFNYRTLANNFSIKEAFSKSVGLGFRKPCFPNNISVSRDKLGKPIITPQNDLKKYLVENYGDFVIHVSLSDTKKYSIASVIIEKI